MYQAVAGVNALTLKALTFHIKLIAYTLTEKSHMNGCWHGYTTDFLIIHNLLIGTCSPIYIKVGLRGRDTLIVVHVSASTSLTVRHTQYQVYKLVNATVYLFCKKLIVNKSIMIFNWSLLSLICAKLGKCHYLVSEQAKGLNHLTVELSPINHLFGCHDAEWA